MSLIAAPQRLIVKPITVKTTIILTDEEDPNQGVVVSVGSNLDEHWLGKLIVWKKFSGQVIEYQGTKYRSITEDEVLGFII